MGQALTTTEQSISVNPQDVVEIAAEQARILMRIVDQTKCYQTISGKKYLQVEAWETIGAFNRVHAVTESITPIMNDGVKVGYDAKVTLVNHEGILVGAAIMPCYFTENACKGKEGDAKDKACKSAAQTFATSKAYRMNYSYVAILAGYQPTPAEEMTGEASDERPANLEHWCEEHKTKFFKRGKMPGYAHPIKGTEPTEWCREVKPIHTVEQVAREMARATTSTPEDAQNSGTTEEKGSDAPAIEKGAVTAVREEGKQPLVDLVWLKESVGTLNWKNKDVVAWLRSKANYMSLDFSGSLTEIIARMDKEQAAFLVAEIGNRLKMV